MVVATRKTITKCEFLIGKKKVDLFLAILILVILGAHIEFSCTRVPRTRWQLEVQNCWALRHGQAFLSASFKQKPVHVYTEISLRPGWAATSMSLSSISSRVKFISMMAGEKNHHPSIHVKLHELLHLMRVWMELSDNWQMAKILTDNWQIA